MARQAQLPVRQIVHWGKGRGRLRRLRMDFLTLEMEMTMGLSLSSVVRELTFELFS